MTARPGTINQKNAIALLEEHGWTLTRGGKHSVKMIKEGERPITLPMHSGREYGRALTHAILRQAGLH